MFDFWHFFNSGESLDVLRQLTPQHAARITSLQLNDLPGKIDDFSRAQNWAYRKGMFQNAVDSIRVLGMDAFLKVAPAIGVEVFNLEHHELGAADIAQRAMKSYEAVVRSCS